ncbi:hypothetical protein NVV94_01600 [Pseudomonas sp. LS1212]|uniref:hypothetical protein n=1 Tax=Pseudomonas sp. LS1212 TaxID=2972478 RepID=UPI00215C16EE|nr:hypothetical protein [Pseudomonas sp. LS1212]UVJ44335.1 hypothetical protein NVV94_01600 [Pseudomonas sp. LS1212]
MHGSERKDGLHSTPEDDPRPNLWPRVMFSLALVGLMVGLMIGRLTAPEPRVLEQIEVVPAGLQLWFNEQPEIHGEHVDGAVALLINAQGKAQQGRLQLAGKPVSWRVRKTDQGLLLNLVAARPVRGEWAGATVDGRWRLEISLREE